MNAIDWKNLIRIDKSWSSNVLTHQFTQSDKKICVCLHSITTTGTQVLLDSLIRSLAKLIPAYVLGEAEIQKLADHMEISHRAVSYFGNTDPDKDGKYGELLLFALVESILECKMVAHKVKSLSSLNDQIKGGDGVFLGEYKIDDNTIPAYLVGESKVYSDRSGGVGDAFRSINRMHNPSTSQQFREAEWFVASNHLISDPNVNIDELYDTLNLDGAKFKNLTLVHPILVMYSDSKIPEHEKKSTSKEHLEELLAEYFLQESTSISTLINNQLQNYQELAAPYLHFFMVPVSDVSVFRNGMYQRLHHAEFRPKNANHGSPKPVSSSSIRS